MHTSACPNFAPLVKIGERIERAQKVKQDAERRSNPSRWGKQAPNEVFFVSHTDSNQAQNSRPQAQTWGAPQASEPRKRFTPRQYTPLPRPLSKLLPMLLEGRLVAKEVPRDSPPMFPEFDINKSCEYHMGEKGHNVDNCLVLKNKVQNLIDRGMVDFKEPEPNVHHNPLPGHQEVNVIEDDDSEEEYEAWKERRRRGDKKFIEEARANGETLAAIEGGNGGYRFMVKMTPPAWARDPNLVVKPDGWGGLDDLERADGETSSEVTTPGREIEKEFEAKLKIMPNERPEDDMRMSDEVVGKHVISPEDQIGGMVKDFTGKTTERMEVAEDGGGDDNGYVAATRLDKVPVLE